MQGFIGEIRQFGGNFAPRNWAFCNGQLLAISQNTALFSILGTTYGGDGRTTFALPDLKSRTPIHAGTGPGLSTRRLGAKMGTPTNTLNQLTMPAHNHTVALSGSLKMPANTGSPNDTDDPSGAYFQVQNEDFYADAASGNAAPIYNTLNLSLANTGNSQPINNLQPYNAIYSIICLYGTFPSRS